MITVREKPFKVVGVGSDRQQLKMTLSMTLTQAGYVKDGAKFNLDYSKRGSKRVLTFIPLTSGTASAQEAKFGTLVLEFQVRGTFAGIAVPSLVRDTVGIKAGDRYVVQYDSDSGRIVLTFV